MCVLAMLHAQHDKTVNSSSWEVIISEPASFLPKFDYANTSLPKDRKWVVAGHKASGPLVLQFTVTAADTEQPIMLCRPLPANESEEEQRLQPETALDNVSIYLNGEVSSAVL